MKLTLDRRAIDAVPASWLVLGVFEDEAEPPEAARGTALEATIARMIADKELTGSFAEMLPLYHGHGLEAGSVLLVGLGQRTRFEPGTAFSAGFAVSKRLAAKRRDTVTIVLPHAADLPATASALIEGAIVGTKSPALKKSEPNRHEFNELTLLIDPQLAAPELPVLERALRRGEIVGQAVNLARELVNTPAMEKSPPLLAERVAREAAAAGIVVDVWDEAKIQSERFGGLMGVAAGSDQPPRFVILDYHHGGDSPTFALVGKGVTFDSGGLNLKPAASMEDMKSDMTGAAVVVAAMLAAARLELPVNVTGYLPITENMTGGRAIKLGDVLSLRNGKTVEIMNTDAEGRLILGDALAFAAERQPHRILDLATLTGACIVALGLKVAGLFGNDDAFAQDVASACRATGERVWRMPLDDDYKDQLKSPVADFKNVGGKWAGAITAAKFLEQFVAATPWVHLDIAGPSWSDNENNVRDAGGTGCFVRSLVAYLERAAFRAQATSTD
jgi:leucyl aminopeptidase